MKILEWMLNLIFSISSLWDKSNDDLLNEHRAFLCGAIEGVPYFV